MGSISLLRMKTGLCLMFLVLAARLEAGPKWFLVETEDSHGAEADYSIQKKEELDKNGCRSQFSIGRSFAELCCLQLPESKDECCHDPGDRDGTNRTLANTVDGEFPYGPDGVYCLGFNENWEKEKDSLVQEDRDYLILNTEKCIMKTRPPI